MRPNLRASFSYGIDVDGYRILRTQAFAVPNAIAGFLLHLRDTTGKIPHVYFGWSEGNPLMYLARYILFGEGDTAPVTREILRQAESDPEMRFKRSRRRVIRHLLRLLVRS